MMNERMLLPGSHPLRLRITDDEAGIYRECCEPNTDNGEGYDQTFPCKPPAANELNGAVRVVSAER